MCDFCINRLSCVSFRELLYLTLKSLLTIFSATLQLVGNVMFHLSFRGSQELMYLIAAQQSGMLSVFWESIQKLLPQ